MLMRILNNLMKKIRSSKKGQIRRSGLFVNLERSTLPHRVFYGLKYLPKKKPWAFFPKW